MRALRVAAAGLALAAAYPRPPGALPEALWALAWTGALAWCVVRAAWAVGHKRARVTRPGPR